MCSELGATNDSDIDDDSRRDEILHVFGVLSAGDAENEVSLAKELVGTDVVRVRELLAQASNTVIRPMDGFFGRTMGKNISMR